MRSFKNKDLKKPFYTTYYKKSVNLYINLIIYTEVGKYIPLKV